MAINREQYNKIKKLLFTVDSSEEEEFEENLDMIMGPPGKNGKDGLDGPMGPQGLVGAQGPKGEVGEKGDKGKDAVVPDLTPEIKKIRAEILSFASSLLHGGNMNRNIAIGGNSSVLSRYTDINLIAGSNQTISYANNDTTKFVDITISSSGGGSSGYQKPTSGIVNGSNTTFVWTTAPNVMVIDNGRTIQKVSNDTTINWTGTTTTILTIAPNSDIFSTA